MIFPVFINVAQNNLLFKVLKILTSYSFSALAMTVCSRVGKGNFTPFQYSSELIEPCLIVSHHKALLIHAVNISSSFEKLVKNSNKLANPFAPFPILLIAIGIITSTSQSAPACHFGFLPLD